MNNMKRQLQLEFDVPDDFSDEMFLHALFNSQTEPTLLETKGPDGQWVVILGRSMNDKQRRPYGRFRFIEVEQSSDPRP